MPPLPNVLIRMPHLTAILANILSAIGMPSDWHSLSFRSIPPIQSKVQKDKITLKVHASAGGLVRRLPTGTRVKRFTITGSVTGQLKVDVMADGDDSGSQFEVVVDSIQLESP